MTASLDATFSALSDPTRRAILARLAEGEATVNELVAPFKLSQPAISKHLKVLEKAGLISRDATPRDDPAGSRPGLWPKPPSGCRSIGNSGRPTSSASTPSWTS